MSDAFDATNTAGRVLLLTVIAGFPLVYGLWRFVAHRRNAADVSEPMTRLPSSPLATALAEHLSDSTFFRQHPPFTASLNSYWSKQQREIIPECIVKPRGEEELSATVSIIKNEFDRCLRNDQTAPTFAVRSGGHSTIPGASNASGGVVIDLSLFDQIQLAADRTAVAIGCGARWGAVSRTLDGAGLAVAGGRNSDVGVGGLTLGGGYSYFSPQNGFVCDNVLEYRVVLASGAIAVASETQNPRLWRALKGGGSNFGIVTQFTLRAFPCAQVWSGFLYMFSWKAPQVIRAFQQVVDGSFDECAGGPLLCISYVQQIGIQVISTHLMYTKPTPWPECWQGFKSIGRVWSSTKNRTLTSTTDELDSISPAGFRQLHISTTVKNDLATLEFAHATYNKKASLLRKVKGMVWTLVLQPLHTSTMSHGRHNVLGLSDRRENLVIALFTAVWERASDDSLVYGSGQAAIDEIDKYAAGKGTADKFRYLNWCHGTQRPFHSYGDENLQLLKEVSQDFDPDGLFQRGCIGGFKLAHEAA